MKHYRQLVNSLTDREKDILNGLEDGLSNAQIAERLVLSVATVKWYTRQIYSKFHLDDVEDEAKRRTAAAISRQAHLNQIGTEQAQFPADVMPFIGRESEVKALRRLLTGSDNRLITILGPGGAGKTRLALRVATSLQETFQQQVYVMMLQHIQEAGDVLPALARLLELPGDYDISMVAQIASHPRMTPALLVLDNVEHLLDAAPLVLALLQHNARLRCLLTSRKRLLLHGETVFPLRGLACPEANIPASEARSYPAVDTFVSIAQHVNSHWRPDENDLAQIVRICRLVDGLPLALHLAGRRTLLESLDDIARHIETGHPEQLTSETADLPVRHRNIERMLQSTFERLSASEQRLYSRLGVFDGTFTLQAALTVGQATDATVRQLMQNGILDSLEPGRFRLHPLVRQHAIRILKESGMYEATVTAFIRFYTQMACEIEPLLISDLDEVDRFEQEWHNLRYAWQQALHTADYESIRQMLVAFHLFGWQRSYQPEVRPLFEAALNQIPRTADYAVLRANLQVRWIHTLSVSPEDRPAMIQMLQAASDTLNTEDNLPDYAFSLTVLGMLCRAAGMRVRSLDYARQSLALYERLNDLYGQALAYYQIGMMELLRHNRDASLQAWQQSKRLSRQVNNFLTEAVIQHRMAGVLWRQGNHQQAISLSHNVLHIADQTGDREMTASSSLLLSLIYFSMGDFETARQHRAICIECYQWVQNTFQIAHVMTQTVYEHLLANRLDAAEQALDAIYRVIGTASHAPVEVCTAHIQLTRWQTLPTPATMTKYLLTFQEIQADMHFMLAVALLVPCLVKNEVFDQALQTGRLLQTSVTGPHWLVDLPAIQQALHTAQQATGQHLPGVKQG